jgi:hypothetical protein
VFKILDDSGLIVGNMLTTFEKEFAWTLGLKKKKKKKVHIFVYVPIYLMKTNGS